jgi:hypothetical protein
MSFCDLSLKSVELVSRGGGEEVPRSLVNLDLFPYGVAGGD